MDELRDSIRSFLRLSASETSVPFAVHDVAHEDGFSRKAIGYSCADESIQALLFEPEIERSSVAVVVLHQHNSQWHLGKSEVAGLAGDPLQAFGPALAKAGVRVLAPDAIGFESRRGPRTNAPGSASFGPALDPARGSSPEDWLQYYNHAMHRLASGDVLMRQVLADVAAAVSVLGALSDTCSVGIVGHSYGGNVALFAAALDTRISFAVSSGALCSYRHKLTHGVGLEMALVIPGFAARFDFDDLVRCVAPRRLFVVSAEDDPFSADAADVIARARPAFEERGAQQNLEHLRTAGAHALDRRRFEAIVEYVKGQR